MRRRPAFLLGLAAWSFAAALNAQQPTPSLDATARTLYANGSRAFAERRYEDAARAFREAHNISHRPELLFNLGQALEAAGDPVGALDALLLFRDAGAPGFERSALDGQIARLRPVAEEARRRASDPQVETRVVETRVIEPRWVRVEYRYERSALHTYGPWVTVGVGGALAIGGLVQGLAAQGSIGAIRDVNAGSSPWSNDAAGAVSSAPGQVARAWAFGGVGVAAVTAGVLWLALRGPGVRREVRLGANVLPTPSGAMFTLGGSL